MAVFLHTLGLTTRNTGVFVRGLIFMFLFLGIGLTGNRWLRSPRVFGSYLV